MAQDGGAQHDLAERVQVAKEMALAIVATCQSYEQTGSPSTLNRFLGQVERLADVAEGIEVERTVRALDAAAPAEACCGVHPRGG